MTQIQQTTNPLRECRRKLSRGIRAIDQEMKDLTAQKQADIKQVKDAAKNGDMQFLKTYAVQLAKTQHRISKNISMKTRSHSRPP